MQFEFRYRFAVLIVIMILLIIQFGLGAGALAGNTKINTDIATTIFPVIIAVGTIMLYATSDVSGKLVTVNPGFKIEPLNQ